MTKADEFKAKRQPDYADTIEWINLVLSIDPDAYARRNEAGNVQVVFSDGSTYVVGLND